MSRRGGGKEADGGETAGIVYGKEGTGDLGGTGLVAEARVGKRPIDLVPGRCAVRENRVSASEEREGKTERGGGWGGE